MSGRTIGVLVKVENSLQGEWRSERWEGANKAQRAGAVVPRNPQKCSVYAQVAEWLMAADCKSAALCATEVRILPCAPLDLS